MTGFDTMSSVAPVRGSSRKRTLRWLAVSAVAVALAGCMAPRPGADLPPYGDSVRHTKAVQTYEPGDEVPPLNGTKAAGAMHGYRLPSSGGAGQASGAMQ